MLQFTQGGAIEKQYGLISLEPTWYLLHVYFQFKHLEQIFTPCAHGKKFKQMCLRLRDTSLIPSSGSVCGLFCECMCVFVCVCVC